MLNKRGITRIAFSDHRKPPPPPVLLYIFFTWCAAVNICLCMKWFLVSDNSCWLCESIFRILSAALPVWILYISYIFFIYFFLFFFLFKRDNWKLFTIFQNVISRLSLKIKLWLSLSTHWNSYSVSGKINFFINVEFVHAGWVALHHMLRHYFITECHN